MARREDLEGGFTKTARRTSRREPEEAPRTLQEQLMSMRKQASQEAPLPPLDTSALPPADPDQPVVQGPSAEALVEHERYTKHLPKGKLTPAAQLGIEAPYGYMEISTDTGNGSATCRIPMTKAQADAQMEHAIVVQKVGLNKDRHSSWAAIGSTLLSVAALGALILGGVAAIRKETSGKDE